MDEGQTYTWSNAQPEMISFLISRADRLRQAIFRFPIMTHGTDYASAWEERRAGASLS